MNGKWLWDSDGQILSPFRAIWVHFRQFDDFDDYDDDDDNSLQEDGAITISKRKKKKSGKKCGKVKKHN